MSGHDQATPVHARKVPGGSFRLYYAGTRTEVYPGARFDTAGEAYRQHAAASVAVPSDQEVIEGLRAEGF